MNSVYDRDLDLNLLRVFIVVAEAGSVTTAARRLYLTQPAVSAALRRLTDRVGEALFARAGRGLSLTARGQQLLSSARPHLSALIDAALSPATFDAQRSDEIVRLGLSDSSDAWLLPALLRILSKDAPRLRLVVLPVQFRTVKEALQTARVDLAITVADELPSGIERTELHRGGFVCLFDPRHVRLPKRLSVERYLAEEHVIVSYNGDLRGIVEDILGLQRQVRISVPTFQSVGPVVLGSALLATVPEIVAKELAKTHRGLRTAELPFRLEGNATELLWPTALENAPAVRFVRERIVRIAGRLAG